MSTIRDLLGQAAARCGGDERAWRHFLNGLSEPVRRALAEEFGWQAHDGQAPPHGGHGADWRTWVILAGRGFGKTRAGSEWIQRQAVPGARIALVATSHEEVERVMVRGPSGLLATAKTDNPLRWTPTGGRLDWANGAVGFAYSAAAAEALRGPEHNAAWCDELAKWGPAGSGRGAAAWANLQMGLRLGTTPQCVVTTTPREGSALLKQVLGAAGTVVTRGRTADNPHLPDAFVAAMRAQYGGTRLGRQELDGVFHEQVAGALWTPALLDARRMEAFAPWETHGRFDRVVVGVDPPAGTGPDSVCGIVVAARSDGRAFVLDDCSVAGASPADWAAAVVAAFDRWDADRVVAETNMGGAMVQSVLRARAALLPVEAVRASAGKIARAEPVAALFETGRAAIAGRLPQLEEELCRLVAGEVPTPSPDRADAMVWALSALMLGPWRAPPRVVAL